MRFRRLLATLVAPTVIAAGVAVVSATPASATPASAEAGMYLPRSSWAHTDVRTPSKSTVNADTEVPVGAWRDERGGYHSAKSYFTFDLTALRGKRLFGAAAYAEETWTADCSVARSTELWRTDLAERPTWWHQPVERVRQTGGSPDGPCVAPYREWDVAEAISSALAAGATKVTLVLRMSEGRQFDPRHGKRFANGLRLSVRYNTPPDVPTALTIDNKPCSATPVFTPTTTPTVRAVVSDLERDTLTARIAVRDVADPTVSGEFEQSGVPSGTTGLITPSPGLLVDGHTYELTMRALDRSDTSAPTPPCRFTVDVTRPPLPGVTSADYPENAPDPGTGGTNIAGTITFDPAGAGDVVRYHYRVDPGVSERDIQAGPDGTATITVTPSRPGTHYLRVSGIDRAGNLSDEREYLFNVYANQPEVTGPDTGELDVPVEVAFSSPRMPGVVDYLYQVNGGEVRTVAAAADGTASALVVPDRPGANLVQVRGRTAAGLVTGEGGHIIRTPRFATTVTTDDYPDDGAYHGGFGVPGEFEFASDMPGTTEFVYEFGNDPPVVVPADANGRATVTLTPVDRFSDLYLLTVTARRANGATADTAYHYFFVNP